MIAGLKPPHSDFTNGDAIAERDDNATKKEITTLSEEFQSLTHRLLEQLEPNRDDPKLSVHFGDIRNTVLFLPQPLEKVYSPLFGKQVERCKSHFEMLCIIKEFWNFIDPELLEHIIKRLGDRDLKSAMKSYCEDLVKFRKSTTVNRLVRNHKFKYNEEDISDECKKHVCDCVAKLHLDPETCTLEELESLRNNIAYYIGCHPLSESCVAMARMHLCRMAASSVVVVWLVALETVDIQAVLSKPIPHQFITTIDRHAIEFLCLDNYIIYPLEEVSTWYNVD